MNIKIIDIHKAFIVNEDPLSLFPFRSNNHYTVDGYRFASESIIKQLDF